MSVSYVGCLWWWTLGTGFSQGLERADSHLSESDCNSLDLWRSCGSLHKSSLLGFSEDKGTHSVFLDCQQMTGVRLGSSHHLSSSLIFSTAKSTILHPLNPHHTLHAPQFVLPMTVMCSQAEEINKATVKPFPMTRRIEGWLYGSSRVPGRTIYSVWMLLSRGCMRIS